MTDEAEKPADDLKTRRAAALAKARAARKANAAARRAAGAEPPAPRPVKEPAPAAEVDPDDVQLSDEDMQRIRAKAKAQVAAERRKALETQALAAELEKLRGKAGMVTGDPEEDRLVHVTIDLGASADSITVNGVKYFQGRGYDLPVHMVRSMLEIMYRTQEHEHDISGKAKSDFYRKPHREVVSRNTAGAIQRRVEQGMGAAPR